MMKIHMKLWVNLFCLLLVGLKVCSAARLLLENNDLNSKAGLACEEASEMKPWSNSGNNATKEKANNLEFRLKENRTGEDAEQESGRLKVQRLSQSEPSPGVGHMQVSRVAKSEQQGAVSHVHEERILGSTPSPGGGH